MKNFLVLIIAVLFLFPSFSSAVTIKLQDGTEMDISGLSDTERTNMIKYVEKMNAAAGKSLGQTATDMLLDSASDPVKLNEWRKLITGTIKDIANDLNVSVNEFVKTPVGLGVAGLIFYKVAGKDLITTLIDVILVIPFWIVIMICVAIATKYFLGNKTEIMTITAKANSLIDDGLKREVQEVVKRNEEVKIEKPIRVCRYNWNSNDARNAFGSFMVGISIVVTVSAFLIVFI